MSKPAFWLVLVAGRDPQRFTQRAAARAYRAALKLRGIDSIIKGVL